MKALLLMALLVAAGGVPDARAAFGVTEATGIDQSPGARVPLDLSFREADGRTVTLREISAGRPFLLVPVLYRRLDARGAPLEGVAAAVMGLPRVARDNLPVVAFAIDPREERSDATAMIKALRPRYPGFQTLVALTGDRENIAAVSAALGYRYAWDGKIGQFDHVAATAVMTPDGFVGRWLYGPTPATSELRLALDEASAGQIGTFSDRMLLLCYHYDPANGCYALSMPGVMRLGAGATVLLLAGFVGRGLRQDRSG